MGVHDETLIEPFAVQEIFVDGFTNYVVSNGVMSCVGYRIQPACRIDGDPMKVIVSRLAWPAVSLDEAIFLARQAQAKPFILNPTARLARH